MPHDTTWTFNGVEWRYYGHVTPIETRGTCQACYADPRSDYMTYQLIDLRDITRLDFPLFDQELSAAFDSSASASIPSVRVAFIAPDNRFDPALEIYMELINRTSWEARTFLDADAARAWCERRDGSQSGVAALRA
ncbi:hypothetical protein [Hyphococcus sp.]|uniref:hypothetical protein n=1 Tax=Hyphococcus sp. TaxID=2038636 RepID=UPI00208292D3|nr:MAG: hypothetical protein DHS20C04_10840 [Marinicaulis sp.]